MLYFKYKEICRVSHYSCPIWLKQAITADWVIIMGHPVDDILMRYQAAGVSDLVREDGSEGIVQL